LFSNEVFMKKKFKLEMTLLSFWTCATGMV